VGGVFASANDLAASRQSTRLTVEVSLEGGVEFSLAVVVGGCIAGAWAGAGEAAIGSGVLASALGAEGAELAVEGAVLGVEGAMLGVEAIELEAGSVLELGVSTLTLALAGAEREAGSRLERLEVLLVVVLLEGAFAAGFALSGVGGVTVATLG